LKQKMLRGQQTAWTRLPHCLTTLLLLLLLLLRCCSQEVLSRINTTFPFGRVTDRSSMTPTRYQRCVTIINTDVVQLSLKASTDRRRDLLTFDDHLAPGPAHPGRGYQLQQHELGECSIGPLRILAACVACVQTSGQACVWS
jgi:hypothetical protein